MTNSEERAVRRLSLCSLLALGLLLPSCRGDFDAGDPGLVLELGISPTPPTTGPTRLIVLLEDTAGAPVPGARVSVEGTMSHAGMVPVLDSALWEGEGHYVVPAFDFTMAGDWILTVRATLPDGRWVQLQRVTDVVGTPPGVDENPGETEEGMHHPGGGP